MRIDRKDPPREFAVGVDGGITIRDCGSLRLEPDEQVTFVDPHGGSHDVARKSWGYYATASLNGRLAAHGLRGALTANEAGKLYVVLVNEGKEDEFERYLADERQQLVCWLDTDAAVADAIGRLSGPGAE